MSASTNSSVLLAAICISALAAPPTRTTAVSPNVLRGHVSFLASDALRGRNTPSPELDIAAEYIAGQFRSMGLDEGAPGYFQTTEFLLEFTSRDNKVVIRPDQIVGEIPPNLIAANQRIVLATPEELATKYKDKRPRNFAVVSSGNPEPVPGTLVIRSAELLELQAPVRFTYVPAGLKNVIAIIRGTTDDCVLVTAHYDHIGTKAPGDGDRIYNGANDDASGVAGLLETARALATRQVKPRRNIVFIAFFGEELGFIGSRYYARNPLFPVADTALQLNLEQLGRTDDLEGPRLKGVTLTGYAYSNLPQMLMQATARSGVRVIDPGRKADEFFERSDNEALAKLGVPAHTLSVAFEFPDYHDVGDEWTKLDYDNMAAVTSLVAQGVWSFANQPAVPEWNRSISTVEPYAKLRDSARPTPLVESPKASAPAAGSSPTIPRQKRRPLSPAH